MTTYYVVVVSHNEYDFIPHSGWHGLLDRELAITYCYFEATKWINDWRKRYTGCYTYQIIRIDETEL